MNIFKFTALERPTIYGGDNKKIVKFLIERAWFKATSFLTGFAIAVNQEKSVKVTYEVTLNQKR